MSKITRVLQKVFAGSASNNGQFGSAQAATFNLTNDVATIQGLAAWADGWDDAIISGQRLPCLEEIQGIDYVVTKQLAYIFQEGIPEYDASTTYFINGLVKSTTSSAIYVSLADNNTGNALSVTTKWAPWVASVNTQCYLFKSGSNLELIPYNGNLITIAGANAAIPSSGVNLTNSGLAASTFYYIYAYVTGGTLTLVASTTVPTVSTSSGLSVMNGDATKTLVGAGYTDGAVAWAGVSSFYNRREIVLASSINASTASGSEVELDSSKRVGFISWGDDATIVDCIGYGSNGTSGDGGALNIGIDSAVGAGTGCIGTSSGTSKAYTLCSKFSATESIGYHFATATGNAQTGGTASYSIGLYVLTRG